MISSLHRMAAAREKNMITITFRDEICSNFLFNAIIYVPRIFFISQTYWFFRHERVLARLHFSLSNERASRFALKQLILRKRDKRCWIRLA
jgi:hypothetical protein